MSPRSPRARWPPCPSASLTWSQTLCVALMPSRCSGATAPGHRFWGASVAPSARGPCGRPKTGSGCTWRAMVARPGGASWPGSVLAAPRPMVGERGAGGGDPPKNKPRGREHRRRGAGTIHGDTPKTTQRDPWKCGELQNPIVTPPKYCGDPKPPWRPPKHQGDAQNRVG